MAFSPIEAATTAQIGGFGILFQAKLIQLTISFHHAKVGDIETVARHETCAIVNPDMTTTQTLIEDWFATYVRDCGAVAGTIHIRQGQGLALVAAVNIPPLVQDVVRWVPWGKGMAGLALETGEPIQTCNLKEDDSGRVKPGARAVAAQAAVALPLKNDQGAVFAVLGVAFNEEREIKQPEIDRLLASASRIPVTQQPILEL